MTAFNFTQYLASDNVQKAKTSAQSSAELGSVVVEDVMK